MPNGKNSPHYRPSREGRKRVYTHLSEEAAIELAVLAKRGRTSVDAILKEALNDWLVKNKADFQVS